jgi:AraC-like DNA-binding protein
LVKYELIATDSIRCPKINSIGYSEDIRVNRYGTSSRNQYIIHYVLSGKGYFNGNRVDGGQGFLITPEINEEYYPDESDPWAFLWIISEDEEMKHFFERHNADPKTGIFKFHNESEMASVANRLKNVTDIFSSSSGLAELFLHIFHSCIENAESSHTSVTKRYFELSVNYIKANLHLPITVNDMCRVCYITQPYLYRIFKEECGVSPKQYITSCKISEAKRLLEQTSLSVSRIAYALGFSSVMDFSKFFSKQTGKSPTEYRITHL